MNVSPKLFANLDVVLRAALLADAMMDRIGFADQRGLAYTDDERAALAAAAALVRREAPAFAHDNSPVCFVLARRGA